MLSHSVGVIRHQGGHQSSESSAGISGSRTTALVGYAELKSQLRRASDSIASNTVEGSAAATQKEFARFLDIGIKSCSEVDYQLQLARDLGVLSHDRWKPLACEVVEIRKMLWGLRRTLLVALDGRTTRGTTKPDDTDDNSDDR